MKQLTLDDLTRVLLECAGVDEEVDLTGDILHVQFEELGYDSLALLNTVRHLERSFSLRLGEGVTAEAKTPKLMLAAVNEALRKQASA